MNPPILPRSLDGRLAVGCILLALMLAAAGAKIVRQQEQLDAKPAVTERVVYRKVQGPTRVEVRTITKPDGEKIVERIRVVEKVEIDTMTEYVEVPVGALAPKKRTRYLGIGVDPLNYARLPRIRAGVTLWNKVDAGVSYDARFSPVGGAVGLELAYRF